MRGATDSSWAPLLYSSICALLVLCAPAAHAMVLLGGDETINYVAPKNGAPWRYAARLDSGITAPASGVYLGDRYVLTAEHITPPISIRINEVDYTLDPNFTPRQVDGVDLKLFRIAGDPGLRPLPILKPSENDLGRNCVVIGWGLGKGTPVPRQGWMWGDDITRRLRWGITHTQGIYSHLAGTSMLRTAFKFAAGPSAMSLANGDSGSPLFVQQGAVWKLAGIANSVDSEGRAFYDFNLGKAGKQPDRSYFIPVKLHRSALPAIGAP